MQLDCGDNSCHFAKDKTGMRTNGGCRCFEQAGFNRSSIAAAHAMLPKYLDMKEALEKIADAFREVNGNRRFTIVDCVAIAKAAL